MGLPDRRTVVSAVLLKSRLYGRVARWKLPLRKWHMTACLEFAKTHWKHSESLRQKILWSGDENWTLWLDCKAFAKAQTEHSSSPIEHHPQQEAWWWQHRAMGMLFSCRDWETCKDWGNNEWSQIQANPWGEPTEEGKRTWTVVNIYVPAGQWPQAYRQSPDLNLIENLKKTWRLLFTNTPQKHDRAWANLQGRMRENPQIQMYKAHTDIPKKTRIFYQ